MNEQQVTKICKALLDPLSKFVETISKSIESLASKDDIRDMITNLEKSHQNDLQERDLKITELENR